MKSPFITPSLRIAYGDFLARWPWQWFVTHTFVTDVHPEAAFKKWRLWCSMLGRDLYGPRKKSTHLYWAASIERQKRGVVHLHGLMAGCAQARRLTWMDKWNDLDHSTGFSRILPVEDVGKSSRYVTKYVAKGGEIEFSTSLRDITNDLLQESCPD